MLDMATKGSTDAMPGVVRIQITAHSSLSSFYFSDDYLQIEIFKTNLQLFKWSKNIVHTGF